MNLSDITFAFVPLFPGGTLRSLGLMQALDDGFWGYYGIFVVQTDLHTARDLLDPLRQLLRPSSRIALLTGVLIATYSTWDKTALDHHNPLVLTQFTSMGYLVILAPMALANAFASRRLRLARHTCC